MKLEHEKITEAIRSAEKMTSGEIQVFVTKKSVADVYVSAQKVFEKIGLAKTQEKNAILFYISEKSRAFAILGDSGIHAKVGAAFWDALRDTLSAHFSRGQFTQGLCETIGACGQALKKYFPHKHNDINELSDQVYTEASE